MSYVWYGFEDTPRRVFNCPVFASKLFRHNLLTRCAVTPTVPYGPDGQ
jgi:hypothetical protein